MGKVVSVNVGRSRSPEWNKRPTAIDKRPVSGPVAVRRLGLEGDEQADRVYHGGVHQAVYAYAREDLDWWEADLGRELRDGAFGENLTLSGVEVNGALLGERWRIGTALLQVQGPRVPCVTFRGWMGEKGWVKRFTLEGRCGAYLKVIEEGRLGTGDEVTIEHRPAEGVTITEALRAFHGDRELLRRVLEVEDRAPSWDTVGVRLGVIPRTPDNGDGTTP
jgi:MOSC domain-containing protein YiiM